MGLDYGNCHAGVPINDKAFAMKRCLPAAAFFLCLCINASAQTLAVQADKYLQNFEGAGISAGLYMGHHYSMPSAASRDLAVRYIARDLNMRFIQDYINIYPADDSAYFTRRADYLKAAKAYRADIGVSMVGNKFPDPLMRDSVIGGQTYRVLNTADPDIYNKVAGWYFELFKAFKQRGVEVDILNVVNEPDYDKVYYYGADGNTKKNVALIFDRAVTRFFAMLADSAINTLHMKKPRVMGPSTISPQGCVDYIQYFKQNYPQVWNMIDIVAYHQYINGVNVGALAQVKTEAGSKPVYQSEMHTNRGDNLGTLPVSDELRGCLSLASLFGNSLRTGANCWAYFQTNYPNPYTPAGLLYVAWQAAEPIRYKHYYAFRQLSSAQPINSHVLEHIKTDLPKVDIVCLRKKQTDTVYVHATNLEGVARPITISAAATDGRYVIQSYGQRITNDVMNDSAMAVQSFANPVEQFTVTLAPFSVNSFSIALKKEFTTSVGPSLQATALPEIVLLQNGRSVVLKGSNNTMIQAVEVVNAGGQVLSTAKGLRQSSYTWQGSGMKAGVYFFRVVTNKGVVVKRWSWMQ